MSPAVGGPALFIGTDEVYVALVRPSLDPADPGVREAAEQAGVTPEEFAGPGNVWALMLDEDGEGDGFELPGARDIEADDFAEQLQRALVAGEPFSAEAGNFLRLEARPSPTTWQLTAHVTPPEGHDAGPWTLELGALPTAELLADIEEFRRTLA
ncbi:hypothetical protein [Streptomyces sp. TBY4]|uniref:hypothetical protein n=1 Tax=Streptomyces sp. TBY4 TaxID=2962030 RepID=UPI0020B8B116|nr:hypothetical protein [Streptomyces sp. TBY4]MCP3760027.1 hypothetical protein [Streptomyces sp. TBY4]